MSRILVLASNGSSSALFVFNSTIFPPQSAESLILETLLPIDGKFVYKTSTETKEDGVSDVSLSVVYNASSIEFDMIVNERTETFLGDIKKASDDAKRSLENSDFNWLLKYGVPFPSDSGDLKKQDYSNEDLSSIDYSNLGEMNSRLGPVMRENFIRVEMSKKEDVYTYTKPYRLFIGTWNVNGQSPTISLSDWLACDVDPPDIVAVGFQELDLSKEVFLFNDTPKESEWLDAVELGLHTEGEYHKVALVRLVGMMLVVFVEVSLAPYVKNVAVDTVGTGIMGKLGNKGAVSMRMDIHNTSICFVNAHLAAHVEEFERRNQDFRDIVSRTSFTTFLPPKHIKDHDQVYWLGDLNYRITDLDAMLVKNLIENEDYISLLDYDQLVRQHRVKRVFEDFEEGVITFRPTYKYDVGTDNWDSSEKNRAPAWCDRILWKGDSTAIKQFHYRSHPILRISDHKPVSAIFRSQIKVIDRAKYRKVYEEVMKKLDKIENDGLPQVSVDATEIVFGTLKFMEPQARDLTITNTGHSLVEYSFIKKLEDETICKEWLRIEPYMGDIKPFDKVEVKLEIYVDKKSAFKLNSGEYKLDDVLVLHLKGGKDIFITVTGNYEHSCFGFSIDALLYVNVPIKEMPIARLKDLENRRRTEDMITNYSIPREVWLLVDHLYRHALKQRNLFEHPGLHSEIILIRNWLDYGSQQSLPGSVHSVAEALLLFLESTSEPVIPYNRHQECLTVNSYTGCKQIIHKLPVSSRNIFVYLCLFLQELLSHSSDNLLDAKTIASLFGSVFLRETPRSKLRNKPQNVQQLIERKKAHFVYQFLLNDITDLINSSI